MPPLQRDDPETARRIITKLLPDPTARRLVLELMVECIQENSQKPETWGITLENSNIGLNIGGGFYCVAIRQKRIFLFYLPVPDDENLPYSNPFTTYPEVKRTDIPQSDVPGLLPVLRPGVLSFVRMAVAKYDRMNGVLQRAHSPGVLRFIENELGVTVPNPVYSQTPAFPFAKKNRYWVGGHNWSTGSKLQEFMKANAWWHGFPEDDTREKANQTRTLFDQISAGDYFAIKGYGGQNDLKIHYVGRVQAIDTDHQRLVLAPLPLPNPISINPSRGTGSWFGTLREVKDPAIIAWIFKQQAYTPVETKSISTDELPLNVILYGPPGTGKTYSTIARAVEIIDDDKPDDMAEAKIRWDELRDEGRIEFVTFHQSYGYEDFVEGIRPDMEDDTSEYPRYEVKPGILKRIAMKALGEMLEPEAQTTGKPAQISFTTLWQTFLSEVTADPEKTYPGLTEKTEFQIEITPRGTVRAKNIKNADFKSIYNTSPKILSTVYASLRDRYDQITTTQVQSVLGNNGHHMLTATLYRELKRIEKSLPVSQPTPVPQTEPEERAEDFLEKGRDSDFQPVAGDEKRFVLVIDEINRGNISKVFGELITLIEDDKRIGCDLALTVTLPYSREKFGLPRNLYLLGTMNTADKSIALVDVALRRRFEFEELMPDFSTCPHLDPEMRLVLEKLNRRIVLRKDRDHQIGHAFFVAVRTRDDFNRAFEKKVIPLLQEYFYGDWDALRFVLGEEDGRTSRFIIEIQEAQGTRGARNKWQWYRDTGKTLDILDALKANYGIGAMLPPQGETGDNG
jgi:hypothetical protein